MMNLKLFTVRKLCMLYNIIQNAIFYSLDTIMVKFEYLNTYKKINISDNERIFKGYY